MNIKTAILLGATGLTGSKLLRLLLEDSRIEKVKVFGRNSTNVMHPKLEEHLGDMFQLKDFKEVFTGDIVFCCIGTTKAKAPDKEIYKKIDYGIPVIAAQLAKANEIEHFQVISAMGADPDSSTFYNKVKGEMERDVLAAGVKHTYILKPSLIGGDRDEKRLGEKIAQIVMSTFDFLIPKKYKIIESETIVRAMHKIGFQGYAESKITSDKIQELGNQ